MKKIIIFFLVLLANVAIGQKHAVGWETGDIYQGPNLFMSASLPYPPPGYSCTISTDYAREGTKSAKFDLRITDVEVGSGSRSELYYSRLQSWADTLDKWSLSVLYPTGYALDREGEIHMQYHHPSGGSPPWAIGTQNGKPYLYISYNPTGSGSQTQLVVDLTVAGTKNVVAGPAGPSGTVLVACPATQLNVWNDYSVYYKRSVNSDGIFRLYRAGVLVFERLGANYNRLSDGSVETCGYIKLGIYKYPWNVSGTSDVTTRVVYVDCYKSGGPGTPMSAMFLPGVPSNAAPVVSAGVTKQIKLPVNTVSITGTASDDVSVSSVVWSKVSGPSVTISSGASLTTNVITTSAGTYVLRLTATDNQGISSSDTMSITVLAANIPPVVNAGVDQSIQLPVSTVAVAGTTTDSDGSVASTFWSKISGPTATINTPLSLSTTISFSTSGTYILQLTSTDNEGGQSSDQVTITVLPANVPPTSNAGADKSITLPVDFVNLIGSGTDPDGSIIRYFWQVISGGAYSIADPNASTLSLSDLVQGTYVLSLTVTDNQGLTSIDNVNIVVNPAPPPPNVLPVANAGSNATVTLPVNSATLNGTGSTDSDGSIVSYSWSKISGPSTFSLINSSTATPTASNMVQGSYVFQLVVTDNRGGISAASVTITVNPAVAPPNTPPTANAGSDITITLSTNSSSLSGSGVDTDGIITGYLWTKLSGPSVTLINSTSATATANNLVQGTYIFQLRVTDNQGATAIDTKQIIVNSAPVNQAPIVSAGPDKTLRLPINFTTLIGTASDPDGTIVSRLWTRISGPNTPLAGGVTTNTVSLFNLIQGTYVFSFRVTDNQGLSRLDYVTVYVQKSRTSSLQTVYKLVNN